MRKIIWIYILWVILGLIIVFLAKTSYASTSIVFLIISSYFLLLPGWLIGRIFQLRTGEFSLRILFHFILSLFFFLIISLAAIFISLNINQLLIAYEILIPILLLFSLLLDFGRNEKISFHFDVNFLKTYLIYLVPILLGLTILIVIDAKGADFNGDPYYHLSIIRKALEGGKLTPTNLSFSLNSHQNPLYLYPAWHLVIASLAKFMNLNIFTVWSKLSLILTIISFLAWYLLAKKIFEKKSYTIIATICFMTFTFYYGYGYIFQRLTVPDTLAQYILLPFIFALFLEIFFAKKVERSMNRILSLAAFVILIVHGLQYFYCLLGIIFFGFLYFLIFLRNGNVKPLLKKYLTILLLFMTPLIILGLVWEIKSGFVSDTFQKFSGSENIILAYANFSAVGTPFKYGLMLAPFSLLFIKENRRLLLLTSLMIIVPLVYYTPLKDLTSRLLSFIFTDRLLANLTLYYFVFALIIGVLLTILEKRISKFRIISQLILILIFTYLIVIEFTGQALSNFIYKIFYAPETSYWIDHWFFTGLVIVLILVLALLFWKLSKNILFKFLEFKDQITGLILVLIISLIFFSPSIYQTQQFLDPTVLIKKTDYTLNAISLNDLGGLEPITFIKENLPTKKVILASEPTSQNLGMLVDEYSAYNLSTTSEKATLSVLEKDMPAAERKDILNQFKVDYIFIGPALIESVYDFTQEPADYEKIYDGQAKIYRVLR